MLFVIAVSGPANTGKSTWIRKIVHEIGELGYMDVMFTEENARKLSRGDYPHIEAFQDAIAEKELQQLRYIEEMREKYKTKHGIMFVDRTYKDNVAYLFYAQNKGLSNLSCGINSLNLALRESQEYDAIVFAHNPIKEVTNEDFKIYDTQEFRNFIEYMICKTYKNVLHISNFKDEGELAIDKLILLVPKLKLCINR